MTVATISAGETLTTASRELLMTTVRFMMPTELVFNQFDLIAGHMKLKFRMQEWHHKPISLTSAPQQARDM